ncbi:MAG: class I SAM-dependent DNA methyltransferase [Nocardioides sp.]
MTEPEHLRETRAAYDTVAADYADLLGGSLAESPWDRAMLAVFAEAALATGGRVADVGCGPGRLTPHLHDLGLDVLGIDLSPGMVAEARRRHPHLEFRTGTLAALDLPDATLGGVLAWYSLIHTPPEELPATLAELARVLAPGGHLMAAFQTGDERLRRETAYGHPVTYDVWRLDPDRVADLLEGAGFELRARVVREPEGRETTPQSYLLATRSGPVRG